MKASDTLVVTPIAVAEAFPLKKPPETSARCSTMPSGYFVAFGVKVKDGVKGPDAVNGDVNFCEGENMIDKVNCGAINADGVNLNESEKKFDLVNFCEGEKMAVDVNSFDFEKGSDGEKAFVGKKMLDEVNSFDFVKNFDALNCTDGEKMAVEVNSFDFEKYEEKVNFDDDVNKLDGVKTDNKVKSSDKVNSAVGKRHWSIFSCEIEMNGTEFVYTIPWPVKITDVSIPVMALSKIELVIVKV